MLYNLISDKHFKDILPSDSKYVKFNFTLLLDIYNHMLIATLNKSLE